MEEFPLHRAAENGNLEQLKHLVNLGQSVDTLDKCDRTPLHLAAECGHYEIAEYLLRNNCDCNRKAYDGTTAVLLAAEHGHKEIVDLLLQFDTDLDSCSEFGKWTVLHFASKREWTETVLSIIDNRKVDLDVKTCVGITPLMLAAEEGHVAIARFLIQSGAKINLCDVDGWTALHYASKKGWLPIVKNIVKSKECDINIKNSSGNTPLHIACSMNNTEIMQELLKAGADSDCVNHRNHTALCGVPMHLAAKRGDLKKVEHLIELGVSVDKQDSAGRTPLHWAAGNNEFEVAECLLQNNCNLNLKDDEDRTPLFLAIDEGHKKVFDLLYRHGAKVSPNPYLLHMVAERGWLDTVQRLVESGEWDVNSATPSGYTPLMGAAKFGRGEVAAFLIRAGADVNSCDHEKKTALHLASGYYYDYTEVVKVLLGTDGLDINSIDSDGYTPLIEACFSCDLDIIKMLLEAGADSNIKFKSYYDYTALNVAWGKGLLNEERIKLFLQHGAFFQDCDLIEYPELEENILKDVDICTKSIVNMFNNQSLPALYSNPYFAAKLPSIDKFILNRQQTEDIKKCVKSEIKTHTFCNVVKARPIVLTMLCVESLLSCQYTIKRSNSPNLSDSYLPLKKPRLN